MMRVGGRFPYLHESESIFAAKGEEQKDICICFCVNLLSFFQVLVSDGPVDDE